MGSFKIIFANLLFLVFFCRGIMIFLFKFESLEDVLGRALVKVQTPALQQKFPTLQQKFPTLQQKFPTLQQKFPPFSNFDKDVQLLHWICIPLKTDVDTNKCEQPIGNLVAYNSNVNHTTTVQSISVTYRTEPIPPNYKILANHTMIVSSFPIFFWPGNIYHYIVQYFIPSHHLVDLWRSRKLTEDTHLHCK